MPSWREPVLRRTYEGLIRAALPNAQIHKIRLNTEGYLNVVFDVDGGLIFRFPRSAGAAKQVEMEVRLLPTLARRLRIPVPEPLVVGSLPGRNGWPFMGYRKLRGEGLPWGELGAHRRETLVRELAPVLRDLARFPWREARRLGVPGGDAGAWRQEMTEFYRRVRRNAFPLIPEQPRAETDREFRAFLEDKQNFRFRPALVHGEIHSDHVLWDRGRVTGLIDWGFASVGDPARELAPWVAHFGTLSMPRFMKGRAGPPDRTFLQRVEFYRFLIPLRRILHSATSGDLAAAREGVTWLRRALRLPPTQGWSR
jgi:aminoglycoside 2''-phosphotransferase